MIYTLQNNSYRVQVKSKGAELCSFVKLDENLEYMWQADPEVWASHAPNLFPIVGELPDQEYEYKGKMYQLPRHGFARRKEFTLVQQSEQELVLELKADAETLPVYPFDFLFRIKYVLEQNKLTVTYQVENPAGQELYFSVGAHPGFNVPFYPEERFSDYFLEFDQKITADRYLLNEKGLLSGETERVLTAQNELPLQHALFENDALVFKHLPAEQVSLHSHKNSRKVTVSCAGFPYLGIWTKPGNSRFICIEPWCGIAGSAGASKNITEKEGIIKLQPGQVFERSFSIAVS